MSRGVSAPAREDGFVATELALGLGLLVLPVACLVLTLPGWSERQVTARSIAREVARTVARERVCDTGVARDLGASMATNLGLLPFEVRVALGCRPGATLAPGTEIEAGVDVVMPAVHIPGIGSIGSWRWTARHREPVDEYGSAP